MAWKTLSVVSIALLTMGSPAYAEFNGQPCQCRTPDGKVDEGTIRCISTPEGDRMMRCQMVLNNSAWVPLQQDSCAVGNLSPMQTDLLDRIGLG
jgi:hypothetical protein